MNILKPILDSVGRDSSSAEFYYNAILDLIERANTDNDSRPSSMTAYLANPERLARDHVIREMVGRRTLTRNDVMECLSIQTVGGVRLTGAGFDGSLDAPSDTSASRLVRKLRAGGIGPTGISSAMRLRGAWLAAWAELRTGLPGDAAELADLKTRVLHLAGTVEDEVRGPGSYGVAMNRRLSDVLRPNALGRSLPIVLDPLHILGLAYELCDECQIWFSDPSALQGRP